MLGSLFSFLAECKTLFIKHYIHIINQTDAVILQIQQQYVRFS
jgi:hypothetical protein